MCIILCLCYIALCVVFLFFFFKQKTAYEMRISDWSSDVCSSDLDPVVPSRIDRELELGTDPVVRGDEQRVAEPRRLQVEEAAEAAEIGVGARPARRTGQRGDGTDQRIAGVDRYAGQIGRAHV